MSADPFPPTTSAAGPAPATPAAGFAPPRRFPPLPGAALPAAALSDAAALARLTQGSAAWIAARVGRVTASRLADVVGRTRTGYGAARAAYLAELLAERLSGRPAEPYVTPAMAWGRRHEAGARAAYEFFRGVDVGACGFLLHPTLAMAGASPDGLVGPDGLLEIKCPTTAAHLDLLLKGVVPERHLIQMQWQMACAGRRWCDYLSFDPRLPEPARLVIRRVACDDARIAALEQEVDAFLAELAAREAQVLAATGAAASGPPVDPGAAAETEEAADRRPARPRSAAALASAREDGDGAPPTATSALTAAASPRHKGEHRPRARESVTPARVVDLAGTRRKALTPRQRLALYEAHGGICCICGNRIIGARWVDEHIRPLSLGGSNDLENRAPAHERCAQEKTRDDLRRLAKAKAQKRAHLGLKAATRAIASRPFPPSDRIRPNLSPLGPPRAARFLSGPADDGEPHTEDG